MKKIKIVKTNWIKGLFLTSMTSLTIFFASLVIFILEILFTNAGASSFLVYDNITFPVQLILAIITVVSSVYFIFNTINWFQVMTGSTGKRKIFNLIISIGSLLFSVLLLLDVIGRIYIILERIGPFLNADSSSLREPFIVGWLTGSFSFFNVYFSIALSLLFSAGCLTFYFLQKKLYKSEEIENADGKTQKHYLKSFEKSKKKQAAKIKKPNLKKKIKYF